MHDRPRQPSISAWTGIVVAGIFFYLLSWGPVTAHYNDPFTPATDPRPQWARVLFLPADQLRQLPGLWHLSNNYLIWCGMKLDALAGS